MGEAEGHRCDQEAGVVEGEGTADQVVIGPPEGSQARWDPSCDPERGNSADERRHRAGDEHSPRGNPHYERLEQDSEPRTDDDDDERGRHRDRHHADDTQDDEPTRRRGAADGLRCDEDHRGEQQVSLVLLHPHRVLDGSRRHCNQTGDRHRQPEPETEPSRNEVHDGDARNA